MFIRLAFVFMVVLLTGCGTLQSYSDLTNAEERKSYIACAVTRAFLNPDHELPPHENARIAIGQCKKERLAVYTKLIQENVDKPFGMRFVETYMHELHATMLDHIAMRLEQSRLQRRGDAST